MGSASLARSLMQADAAHPRQCQPCTILHLCRQTLLIRGSASLARSLMQADAAHPRQYQSCTIPHAGRRGSSEAVPALHDPSCRQTLLTRGSASLARSFTHAVYTCVHLCAPVCTCMPCTFVHLCAPACTSVHLCAPACTCVHLRAPAFT